MKVIFPLFALMVLLGCAQPPVDPEQTFIEAFELPLADSTIILSGGSVNDGWIVFESEERVALKNGESYRIFNPQPAYEFFAERIPEENLGKVDDFVCLAWRETQGNSDSGAYLLFIPGKGVYHFRSW